MNTRKEWSKPYYGVSHYGIFSTTRRWATVVIWDTFTEISLWFPGCGFNPTHSTKYGKTHEQDAKREASQWVDSDRPA